MFRLGPRGRGRHLHNGRARGQIQEGGLRMSARIEAVKFVRSNNGLFGKGSIKLAVDAALGCLKEVDMPASDVDLLINTGIYRDDNIGEPAIAALIQQGIRANPGVREDGGPGTFSFD